MRATLMLFGLLIVSEHRCVAIRVIHLCYCVPFASDAVWCCSTADAPRITEPAAQICGSEHREKLDKPEIKLDVIESS